MKAFVVVDTYLIVVVVDKNLLFVVVENFVVVEKMDMMNMGMFVDEYLLYYMVSQYMYFDSTYLFVEEHTDS